MEKNDRNEFDVTDPMEQESFALMNTAAFRMIMRVVQEAVYGDPLDRNSTEIKDLYDFLESQSCMLVDRISFDPKQ